MTYLALTFGNVRGLMWYSFRDPDWYLPKSNPEVWAACRKVNRELVALEPVLLGENITEGWIEISSNVPIVGAELIHGDDASMQAWGLAAIEAQSAGSVVYLPHYDVSAQWWTWLSVANPDDNTFATGRMKAYSNAGTLAGVNEWFLVANGGGGLKDVKAWFMVP